MPEQLLLLLVLAVILRYFRPVVRWGLSEIYDSERKLTTAIIFFSLLFCHGK